MDDFYADSMKSILQEIEFEKNGGSVATYKLTVKERIQVLILGIESVAQSIGLFPQPLLQPVPIIPPAEVCNVLDQSHESMDRLSNDILRNFYSLDNRS